MIQKDESILEFVKDKLLLEDLNLSIESIISKAIERYGKILEFKEPDPNNMLEIEESEELATDARLFQSYNNGFGNDAALPSVISELSRIYENVIKFEYKAKEIVIAFEEFTEYMVQNSWRMHGLDYHCEEWIDFTLFLNIPTKKRLLCEWWSNNEYNIASGENLDKFDEKNDARYAEYLSDRVVEWKTKESLNLEKYQLTDSDKDFFKDLYASYEYSFTLSMKDGILCINSHLELSKNEEKNVREICYFIQAMMKIIERFCNI